MNNEAKEKYVALDKYIIAKDLEEKIFTSAGLEIPKEAREGVAQRARVITAPKDCGLNEGDIFMYAGAVMMFKPTLECKEADALMIIEPYKVFCKVESMEVIN